MVDGKVKRNIQVGEFFIGQLENSKYTPTFDTTTTGFTNVDGNRVDFLEQFVKKRFSIKTDTSFFFVNNDNNLLPDSRLLSLFFLSPELAGNDVLIVENAEIFRNKNDNSYIFTRINFVSLGDKFKKINRTISNLINFAEPGG